MAVMVCVDRSNQHTFSTLFTIHTDIEHSWIKTPNWHRGVGEAVRCVQYSGGSLICQKCFFVYKYNHKSDSVDTQEPYKGVTEPFPVDVWGPSGHLYIHTEQLLEMGNNCCRFIAYAHDLDMNSWDTII